MCCTFQWLAELRNSAGWGWRSKGPQEQRGTYRPPIDGKRRVAKIGVAVRVGLYVPRWLQSLIRLL